MSIRTIANRNSSIDTFSHTSYKWIRQSIDHDAAFHILLCCSVSLWLWRAPCVFFDLIHALARSHSLCVHFDFCVCRYIHIEFVLRIASDTMIWDVCCSFYSFFFFWFLLICNFVASIHKTNTEERRKTSSSFVFTKWISFNVSLESTLFYFPYFDARLPFLILMTLNVYAVWIV